MNKEDIVSIVPLLPAQQFLLAASFKERKSEYVQQLFFEVHDLEWAQVKTGLESLSQIYECFRSHILYEGIKQAVWVSLKKAQPKIERHQIDKSHLASFIEDIRSQGFDFQKEPPIRFDWIVSDHKNHLLITNHHLLCDGWGRQKILSDFIQITKYPKWFLPEKTNKNWYDGWRAMEHPSALNAYRNYLFTFDQFAEITQIPDENPGNLELINELNITSVQVHAKSLGLTLAEYVNFSWICFVSKWTQNECVQFGVVKQNGLIEQVKNGFGLAIQTLPCQYQMGLTSTPSEQLYKFKNREREIAPYPFADVSHEVFHGINYNFIIAFENYPLDTNLNQAASQFELKLSFDYSEFPLSLALTPNEGKLKFQWHYHTGFHSTAQIETISQAYQNYFLDFKSQFNKAELSRPESNKAQKKQRLDGFLFFEAIEKSLHKEGRLELYHKTVEIFIQSQYKRIWLFGDKHEHTDLVICAAWKAHVEVLTVNEKESEDFIEHLKSRVTADLIFDSDPHSEFFHLDNLENLKVGKSLNLEYTKVALSICTSGSTGTPKVVQLSLENIKSFFYAWNLKVPWREQECFASIAHPAFDIGVAELVFPLWKGWRKKILPKSYWSESNLLIDFFEGVTAFHMVPALLERWIEIMPADQIERTIMTGGDRVPQTLQKALVKKFPKSTLFQFYGPSECSVLITGFENTGLHSKLHAPIGDQFEHGEVHVMDKAKKPTQFYQEGEIIITGDAVGLGYVDGDPDGKFFKLEGIIAYSTGDIAYRDPNGFLFFRGRKDQQIKINGQRIELSRIEQALKEWSGIDKWIVIYDAPQLAAFYVSEKTSLPDRSQLHQTLPAYAIPQLIQLDNLPLNKNGKIDLQSLKAVLKTHQNETAKDDLPEAWKLAIATLFPNQNYREELGWYANGFNSIDALKLAGKIKKSLNLDIQVTSILTCGHLSQLPSLSTGAKERNRTLIQVGMPVHEAASRMFFLSESDPKLEKSYWIHVGYVMDNDSKILSFVNDWLEQQTMTSLKVSSSKSSYFWAKSTFKPENIEAQNAQAFIDKIYNKPSSIFDGLFQLFICEMGTKLGIAFKIHHGLLDGLGVQQFISVLLEDLKNESFTVIKLAEPETEIVDKAFWSARLKSILVQKLPFQRPQNPNSQKSWRHPLSITEKRLIESIKLSKGCSSFEASLILWAKLWAKYFPQRNFATGVIVNMRDTWEEDVIEAMSVNTLPFPILTGDEDEILSQWKTTAKMAKQSFAEIAKLEENKQIEGTPYFNTTIVHNQWKKDEKAFQPLNFELKETAFDLSLDYIDDGDEWYFQWEFNSDKLSLEAVKKFHHYMFLGIQKQEVTETCNGYDIVDDWNKTVVQHASMAALKDQNQVWSFTELNAKINELASKLKYPGTGIIPLILERKAEHIALVMACIINKIPFIPIDSDQPKERIKRIESVCHQEAFYLGVNEVEITANPMFTEDIIYAIATSGSTGAPKLVGVKRSGYAAAIESWRQDYDLKSDDKILQSASFSFDVFMGDLGRSLFNGAELILLNAFERKDPDFILQSIHNQNITFFETTPMVIRWWLDQSKLNLPSLKLLVIGSDSWRMSEFKQLKEKLGPNTRVISSYGLSETTIDNSFFDWSNEYGLESIVPIGKAMTHSVINITDENGVDLPRGKEGLICIEGPCLGKGYFEENQWTLKVDKWVTADRGTQDEFGNFHFLGRDDKQVKIRGQRLELQEIDVIFASIAPEFHWTAFDYDSGFSQELGVAYIGLLSEARQSEVVKKILSQYPNYYLPSRFIEVETFKMSPNGKIDRDALRLITPPVRKNNQKSNVQSDKTSERIQGLILDLFGKKISKTDQFFSMGLSSFDAMYFVREWNGLFQDKIQVFQLFSCQNFGELSRNIGSLSVNSEITIDTLKYRTANRAQEAIWVEIQTKDPSIYNLPHFIKLPHSKDFKSNIESTLKLCVGLFSRFEVDPNGRLIQHFLKSTSFQLDEISIAKSEFERMKSEVQYKKINLENGPCFEAALVECESDTYLYFNPHHIVYDGGSDSALAEIYRSIQAGEEPKPEILEIESQNKLDWTPYFLLAPSPNILKGSPANKLEETIVVVLNAEQEMQLMALQKNWESSQAVIQSTLLGRALHSNNVNIEWISLVMDTRTSPSVGMHMRAFPFPVKNNVHESESIGISKASLTHLFKHQKDQVNYPKGSDFSDYHQVGLIIQHPVDVVDESEREHCVMSRPRMPLSLYVENINQNTVLRWEYDSGYFSKEMTIAITYSYLEQLEKLSSQSIVPKWIDKKLVLELESNQTIYKKNGQLGLLWDKYLGNGNQNDFFLSGGSSLQALMLLKEMERSLKIKMTPSAFFKNPTFTYLESFQNKEAQIADGIMWEMQTGSNGIDWYLPPIMGLGLVFNGYRLRPNVYSLSFSYPAALTENVNYFSIEELAQILLDTYCKQNEMPTKIDRLIGFSMGGLVAFEVIKLLEKQNCQVGQLVIWDTPSQSKSTTATQIELNPELLKYVEQISDSPVKRLSMIHYLMNHQEAIEKYVQIGKINTPLAIYYCKSGFDASDIFAWKTFTNGECNFNEIVGYSHYEIPDYWKKEAH